MEFRSRRSHAAFARDLEVAVRGQAAVAQQTENAQVHPVQAPVLDASNNEVEQ